MVIGTSTQIQHDDHRRGGFGRESAGRSERDIQWAPRGRGRTSIRKRARGTGRRGVFEILEADRGDEGPIGDEWDRWEIDMFDDTGANKLKLW